MHSKVYTLSFRMCWLSKIARNSLKEQNLNSSPLQLPPLFNFSLLSLQQCTAFTSQTKMNISHRITRCLFTHTCTTWADRKSDRWNDANEWILFRLATVFMLWLRGHLPNENNNAWAFKNLFHVYVFNLYASVYSVLSSQYTEKYPCQKLQFQNCSPLSEDLKHGSIAGPS